MLLARALHMRAEEQANEGTERERDWRVGKCAAYRRLRCRETPGRILATVIDVARERCQGRNFTMTLWRIPWTARLRLSATSRHPRLDARDVRSKTIPPVFKAWAEKERKHGAVIFDDEKAISPSDTSGQVQALEKREMGLDKSGLFSGGVDEPRCEQPCCRLGDFSLLTRRSPVQI